MSHLVSVVFITNSLVKSHKRLSFFRLLAFQDIVVLKIYFVINCRFTHFPFYKILSFSSFKICFFFKGVYCFVVSIVIVVLGSILFAYVHCRFNKIFWFIYDVVFIHLCTLLSFSSFNKLVVFKTCRLSMKLLSTLLSL